MENIKALEAGIKSLGTDMCIKGGIESLTNLKYAIEKATQGGGSLTTSEVIEVIDYAISIWKEAGNI
jgi:hypothetical protein